MIISNKTLNFNKSGWTGKGGNKVLLHYIQNMEFGDTIIHDILYINGSLNNFKLLFQSSFEPLFQSIFTIYHGLWIKNGEFIVPILKMESLRLKKKSSDIPKVTSYLTAALDCNSVPDKDVSLGGWNKTTDAKPWIRYWVHRDHLMHFRSCDYVCLSNYSMVNGRPV